MDPAILLAQTDVVVQVRVQPGALDSPPESLLVQEDGTCSDNDPIDAFFLDIVRDKLLARI